MAGEKERGERVGGCWEFGNLEQRRRQRNEIRHQKKEIMGPKQQRKEGKLSSRPARVHAECTVLVPRAADVLPACSVTTQPFYFS